MNETRRAFCCLARRKDLFVRYERWDLIDCWVCKTCAKGCCFCLICSSVCFFFWLCSPVCFVTSVVLYVFVWFAVLYVFVWYVGLHVFFIFICRVIFFLILLKTRVSDFLNYLHALSLAVQCKWLNYFIISYSEKVIVKHTPSGMLQKQLVIPNNSASLWAKSELYIPQHISSMYHQSRIDHILLIAFFLWIKG
jgi:hypothetical protein